MVLSRTFASCHITIRRLRNYTSVALPVPYRATLAMQLACPHPRVAFCCSATVASDVSMAVPHYSWHPRHCAYGLLQKIVAYKNNGLRNTEILSSRPTVACSERSYVKLSAKIDCQVLKSIQLSGCCSPNPTVPRSQRLRPAVSAARSHYCSS